MANSLLDLNDYLFESLERLSNPELDGEQLENEIGRSKAIVGVAGAVVSNSNTLLRSLELQALNPVNVSVPKELTGSGNSAFETNSLPA